MTQLLGMTLLPISVIENPVVQVIAQIVGIAGMVTVVVMYLGRQRKTILLSRCIGDILWFTHYLLIGANSGAALNVVGLCRETVFLNKGKKKWASHPFWLYFFLGITICSCLLTWEGPISLLPMAGSCSAVLSFWCTKPIHIRLLAIPVQILWLLYGVLPFHPSIQTVLCNSFALVTIGVGLWQDVKEGKAKREK